MSRILAVIPSSNIHRKILRWFDPPAQYNRRPIPAGVQCLAGSSAHWYQSSSSFCYARPALARAFSAVSTDEHGPTKHVLQACCRVGPSSPLRGTNNDDFQPADGFQSNIMAFTAPLNISPIQVFTDRLKSDWPDSTSTHHPSIHSP